jgi:hypothetical protein
MLKRLRKLVFCVCLLFSVPLLSTSMTHHQVEELLHTMNSTKVEFSLPTEDDNGRLR